MSLSIDEVRQWFSACGYAVSEEVGAFGGSVDRFATPRHGLMPPRTWWTVVPRFPDDLYAATENLDLARDNIGADRALAIVTEEVTPDGYSPDLNGGVANYVSARHLALHLAGVFDELSAMVREPRTSLYFSHRIRAPSGETMDACERIDTWIEQGTEGELEIRGGPSETIAEVVRETARRRAERFLERPDHVVPIVFASPGAGARTMLESLLERGWIVRANISRSSGGIIAIRRLAVPTGGPPTLSRRVEELVEMSVIDAVAWFRAAAPEAPAGAFRALLQRDETARRLLQGPIMRGSILHAALEEQRSPVDDSWLPRVLARAFQSALDRATGLTSRPPDTWAPVEEAALREFALGESDLGLRRYLDLLLLVEVGLLRVDQRAPRERGEGSGYKFASTCVRDWFLARKIARDVRAGNSDVLARYVFPRDVGLFLAVIAPDVAAHASSSRAEEIRRDVESEVARRVELTLGHQLNRSIGAIGAHARTVRRALRESEMDDHLRGGPRRGRLNVEDTPAARVLLVEDDDGNATDYLAWLRDGRHTVQRAKAASDAAELADSFEPDVVLLDMQIPSVPEAADADVVHGLRTLDELVRRDPFRPVVVVTAHSRNRELMRDVLQRTHGGQFVFKDDRNLEQSLLNAVAVAVNQPAFRMSRAVRDFRALITRDEKEDVYRRFIHRHWREILGPEYREVRSPYTVTRGGEIDLYAIRHDGFPDLWELKLPSDPIFKSYNDWHYHSDACARAIGQLMEYFDEAEKNARTGSLSYEGRKGVDVITHRPRGFVVLGRYSEDPDEQRFQRERLRLENSFFAGLTVMTYDDLVERAEQYIGFLQRYRSSEGP